VHVSTVRRLEASGELHPQIGPGGIRYFTVNELLRVERRQFSAPEDRTTEVRLAAFKLFQQGVDWRDVAIRLHYDPYRVHRLWRLYIIDKKSRRDDGDDD